jgi:hypothetical protein
VVTVDASNGRGIVLIAQKKASFTALASKRSTILVPRAASEDIHRFATTVQDRLREAGVLTNVAKLGEEKSLVDNAIISLLEAENAFVHDLDDEHLSHLQELFSQPSKGGIWVKRGNAYVNSKSDPAFHASTGLLRVLRNENLDSQFAELALAPDLPLNRSDAVDHLLVTFLDQFETGSLGRSFETEFAELDGDLYIPRLDNDAVSNRRLDVLNKLPPPQMTSISECGRPLLLNIGNPTDRSTLRFVRDTNIKAELAEDEVQVLTKSYGVIAM